MTATESVSVRARSRAFPWTPLAVLGAAVFLSITGEMLPAGLLPEMSADLLVPEPSIGLLVTVFAFTVVATSAPLTALTQRMPRRRLLVIALGVLAGAQFLTAISPDYAWVVGSRIVGGLAHGVFWALVAAYAARLVPRELVGRAVAVVLGGGTVALVLGVPLATSLGQAAGWRTAFLLVGVLTALGAVLVRAVLPVAEADDAASDGAASAERAAEPAGSVAERPALRDATVPAVLAVCVVTALTMIGQYAVYTYVAPLLTDVVGVRSASVGPLLFVYGIAGAVGLVLAGSVLGRRPTAGLVGAMVVAAVAVVGIVLAQGATALALVAFALWGVAFGAIPPLLQTRLLQSASPRIRDVASALYTTAFNIGIGGGAMVGALLYGGLGVVALPFAFAVVLLAAVGAVLAPVLRARRQPIGTAVPSAPSTT
ncbi:MFS transporter [Agromyces sp. SYSU T00194]|uniref:MFS transporter n=1 Tax=Agromyces chitinivorans TaxID=3158560 RepID=UPI00339A6A4C